MFEDNVFSRVCLYVHTWEGVPCTAPHMGPGPLPLLVTSGSQYWRHVPACSLEDSPPPLVLTSGGWSMYGGSAAVRIVLECFLVTACKQSLMFLHLFVCPLRCVMSLPAWLPGPMFLPGGVCLLGGEGWHTPGTDIGYQSGRHASYWNAFLCCKCFHQNFGLVVKNQYFS